MTDPLGFLTVTTVQSECASAIIIMTSFTVCERTMRPATVWDPQGVVNFLKFYYPPAGHHTENYQQKNDLEKANAYAP